MEAIIHIAPAVRYYIQCIIRTGRNLHYFGYVIGTCNSIRLPDDADAMFGGQLLTQ